MKIKLQNFSETNQLLILDILDFLIDKGDINIWTSILSKKFFQSLLELLKTENFEEVQMKLLGLIQKWALNLEDKKMALPNFYNEYFNLLKNNVQFPKDCKSNYQIYLSNSNSNNYNKNNNYDYDKGNSDKEDRETFFYMKSLIDELKEQNFEHKYRRLVGFLVKMQDNIKTANLLIDNPKNINDIIKTLREGNNTLIDTISGGKLADRKLMEITLGTSQDINQTLSRDEDFKNGHKPKEFISYFVLNNVIPIKSNFDSIKNNNESNDLVNQIINSNNINNSKEYLELQELLIEEKSKNDILNEKINKLEKDLYNEKDAKNKLNKQLEEANKKIRDLSDQLTNLNASNQKNKIIELQNTIDMKNKEISELYVRINNNNNNNGVKFMTGDNIIGIGFMSVNQEIQHFNRAYKDTEIMARIEEDLYNEYPEFKEKDTYLMHNANKIKRFKTLKENNVKNGDIIQVHIYEDDI